MIKVSFVVNSLYHRNMIFNEKTIARDGILNKFIELKNRMSENNFDIATNDINLIDESDVVIYYDFPKKMPSFKNVSKSYLIMMESPLVCPDNFILENHKFFRKIFTWDDSLVDNKKYFKINYAFKLPRKIPRSIKKENLCCLIVANKNSNYEYELYSERKKLIRWFEKNYIDDFDLYGIGWDEYKFSGPKVVRVFNRISIIKKLMYKYFGEHYPSYKGKIDSKYLTMQDYKFSISYENIMNTSGYITEKILDPMIAGCVPIYLGAENIHIHIPKDCFIDRRNFESNDNLYKYIRNMPDSVYMNYIDNIEKFLKSEKAQKFSVESFANSITGEIINDQKNNK